MVVHSPVRRGKTVQVGVDSDDASTSSISPLYSFAWLLLFLIGWACTLANAQQYTASVKHYGPEDGLSHREVNAIFQDRQGFMWFGTKFGLNRFDGKTFTTFTKERNGLAFDDIQSIAQDADGYLWLLGPYGQSNITLFNPLTNTAISFEERFNKQLTSNCAYPPLRVLNSENGTIFFGSCQSASLITYHPKTGLRYTLLPQFKNISIIQVTARNTVWLIADMKRLIEVTVDGRILKEHLHQEAPIYPCFSQRNAGTELFFFTSKPAPNPRVVFYRIDELGNQHQMAVSESEPNPQFLFPVRYPVDTAGMIWDGRRLWDSTGRRVLDVTSQLSGEAITNRSFLCDRSGWMWLGTSFGVYQVKVTRNHFRRLFYSESNSGETVAAVRGIAVADNQVYANLEKFGLYSCDPSGGGQRRLFGKPTFAGMSGLHTNGAGKLYAGLKGEILLYDRQTGKANLVTLQAQPTNFPPKDSLPKTPLVMTNATVWTMAPYGKNQLIAGGRMGLWFVQPTSGKVTLFTHYNQFAELAQSHVLHIAPDRQGTLWLCTTTGLYVIDPMKGITARYWSGGKNRFYLPADNYQHFYQDSKGIYWLATANSGLIRWDRQQSQYRQFRRTEGLSNDNIYAVYPDRRGNLWLSSDYGVMQFDPVGEATRTYFVQDGITHNEFNRIAHFRDGDGQIYFGSLNGITAFDPRNFEAQQSSAPLPIRLVSFRQFEPSLRQMVDKTQEVTKTRTIVIQPGDQTAVLDFALLNFTDAEKNVYAYQFKGMDKDWTQQTESSLRFNNLPYGTYQLLIKGQAANGQWSANILTIQVEVQRPFYLQTWFIVLTLLVLTVGLWTWMRWRTWNHQQEQKRLHQEIRQATARIEADKELIEEQAQMLQRLNESKSRFFANISHEFRTPLTVILGIASELKRAQPGDLMPPSYGEVELIERNGNNLLRLINQILDLSKIEAGEMRLHLIRDDLVRFSHYVAESFHSLAAQKNIQLRFQSAVESLETDFDPNKLQDILSNLLSNALKFTPPGGTIDFLLTKHAAPDLPEDQGFYEAVSPSNQPSDSWIFLHVRDTGPGIDAEQLPRIFNRFFQIAHHPVPETGGTGIGLSLVRELVVLMNGGLAVRRLPDRGTELIVRLRQTRQAPLVAVEPLEPAIISPHQAPIPTESGAETDPEKPLLLLVEDNDDVAAYIRSCLQETYRILWANNGQAGIDQALKTSPDLILSDIVMPVQAGPSLDGFQLCDTLKNDLRTSHIPIVLLTARATHSDRMSGLQRGADAYLTKPFQRDELRVVLGNLLHSRRLLQQYYSQLALQAGPLVLPAREETDSLEEVFLHRLRSLLDAQVSNADLSIEEICREMGMGRTTLHQKLVALTGMPITRYMRALRLNKAKDLLTTTKLNIAEVAYAVGFEDPKYFSRVFGEEFNISPLNYRRSTLAEQ